MAIKTPKSQKFALQPMGTLKQYNWIPVKDTGKAFTPNRGFCG